MKIIDWIKGNFHKSEKVGEILKNGSWVDITPDIKNLYLDKSWIDNPASLDAVVKTVEELKKSNEKDS